MILSKGLGYLLGILACVHGYNIPKRDYENRNYFLVELDTSSSNQPLIDFINTHAENYHFEHQLTALDNHYVFSIAKNHEHNQFLGNLNSNNYAHMKRSSGFEDAYDALVSNKNLKSIHLLPPKQLAKRLPVPIEGAQHPRMELVDSSLEPAKLVSDKLDIQDPIFFEQWHLVNSFYPGNDVNVSGLWYEGKLGKGVVTAIVDDGLDYENPDLTENFNALGSWDFNDNTNLPLPRLFDDYHGTRCAGEIAAVKNDVCGVGVAYGSQVSGIRILSGSITGADEASALVHKMDVNDIYSCSWGPTDDGKTLSEPELIVKKAFVKGVQQGRKDRGSVYVFASGNGGRHQDSCNFDGYTNSIFSITVGAIDFKGQHPVYSEACSAVMVVMYSSGSAEHIHTTDIHKKCSAAHGGTSAAAPLAAGVYALILEANPNLTWRDVQYVSVMSATPVNEEDGHYQKTALGRMYSHKYGYGKMDSYQMVHFAENWKNVKPQAWYYSDVNSVNEKITMEPDTKQLISKSIVVLKPHLELMNLERIEHVTVVVNIKSTFRGRVGVRLVSPTGVYSDLATFRPGDMSGRGFVNWTFMSVAHWGESGHGEWKIEVFGDQSSNDKTEIEFVDWQLRFFGESIDADKAEVYDIDKDYAAVRREIMANQPMTTSEAPAPTSTEEGTGKITKEPLPTTSVEDGKEKTITSDESEATESPEGEEEEEIPDETGMNKQLSTDHTGQYFIALAIVGFVVVLLLMKFHKTPGSGRRRRRREEYEFDIIPGEDYTDSEDEGDDDSFDLGHGPRRGGRSGDQQYSHIHDGLPDGLPEYEEEMFRIDDSDELAHKEDKHDKKVRDKQDAKDPQADPEDADLEDDRLQGSSST